MKFQLSKCFAIIEERKDYQLSRQNDSHCGKVQPSRSKTCIQRLKLETNQLSYHAYICLFEPVHTISVFVIGVMGGLYH